MLFKHFEETGALYVGLYRLYCSLYIVFLSCLKSYFALQAFLITIICIMTYYIAIATTATVHTKCLTNRFEQGFFYFISLVGTMKALAV